MLALTFLFPAVLGGLAAAAAPVAIHLIMRTRPRRVTFPALRFVRKTHQANLKMLRLKHLILLALRTLAIVLLVLMIARAELPGAAVPVADDTPALAVLVLDNSGSTGYRRRGQSALQTARQRARQVVAELPAGSRAAVLASSSPVDTAGFLRDRDALDEQIDGVLPTPSHQALAPALRRAVEMLARQQDRDRFRQEVYVLTDFTAEAFRDELALPRAEGVQFVVVRCGGRENANVALGAPRLSRGRAPVGMPAAIEVPLRGGALGGKVTVRLEAGGQVRAQTTVDVPAEGTALARLVWAPPAEGLVHARIRHDRDDPLALDNVRYVTLDVGPPPRMLLVHDATAVGATSRELRACIAPQTGRERIRCELLSADRLDARALQDVPLVLLANVTALSEAQWKALEMFVRRGGRLWVVPGPLVSVENYDSPAAQQVLPAALARLEQPDPPARWDVSDLRHPLVAPLAAAREGQPLDAGRFFRRYALGEAPEGTQTALRFDDAAPAILARPLGAGQAVLWNFSPVRPFSNLAELARLDRMNAHVFLALATALDLAQGERLRTLYLYDEPVRLPVPPAARDGVVQLARPGAKTPQTLQPVSEGRAVEFQPEGLGPHELLFRAGEHSERRGLSVNADPAESDLRPAKEADLRERFPPGALAIVAETQEMVRAGQVRSKPVDLTLPLLLGALALLLGEAYFANRFYRQAPQDAAAGQPSPAGGGRTTA